MNTKAQTFLLCLLTIGTLLAHHLQKTLEAKLLHPKNSPQTAGNPPFINP